MKSQEYWLKRKEQRINSYWKDADKLEARLKKEYKVAYKELEKELYTFIAKYGTDNKLQYSQKRIISLMKEIKPHIDNLYGKEQTSLTELLIDVYKDNYLKGLFVLSVGTNVATSFVGLNENAIKTAISFPWSGANFSDRIYNNKNKLIFTLRQELTQSLIRGDSIQQTARNFSKKLDIDYKNSTRLVQTELGAVISESDKKTYQEFDIDKYEYVSTLDDRTSTICKDLDNKVFNLKDYAIGVNAPPMHPRCRSTTVPYFDDEITQRIAKRLDTGKYEYIDSNISYREWEQKFIV